MEVEGECIYSEPVFLKGEVVLRAKSRFSVQGLFCRLTRLEYGVVWVCKDNSSCYLCMDVFIMMRMFKSGDGEESIVDISVI